ncbi:KSR2 Kinase, partial [Onychorhynchus coronatus]|nr:KSR2 Kinase [Onychorhynchus coronatus]
QSKLVKYFSRQLSCKRKVALQERNAKLEGFPQLLHWFRIVDIRKEVMEEIAPGQLSLEELLDMTDDQVCATVEKFGANSEECARLNASLSCLRSVHKSGGSLSKQDWTIQWPTTEPGKENSPGCQAEPGQWPRTHLSQSPKVQPKCGQHHCHGSSPHGPLYTHVDRLTVEAHPGLCPPLESGHRSLPPSPRQRHAAHTPPRTPNIVTTMTPPGTPPVRRRNKLKPPGTPPPSSRKLIHLIPGFTALHRSKSHEFQLGHRVDEAHTPNCWLKKGFASNPAHPAPWNLQLFLLPVLLTRVASSTGMSPLAPLSTSLQVVGASGMGQLLPSLSFLPPFSFSFFSFLSFPLFPSPSFLPLPFSPTFLPSFLPRSLPPSLLPSPPSLYLLPSFILSFLLSFPLFLPFLLSSPPSFLPSPLSSPQLLFGITEEPPSHSHHPLPPFPLPLGTVGPGRSSAGRCYSQRSPTAASDVVPRDLQLPACPWHSQRVGSVGFDPRYIPHLQFSLLSYRTHHPFPPPSPPFQNEEGPEETQESEDDFEEMNLSLLSARNFPRKASQTSIFLQEWDIPFEQLEIGELIGKGRFGQVFHGRWHGEVAIRLIDIERDNEDQLKAFKREVMAYRQTRHENVVLFMGACMSPPHLAIITSLCKGRTLYSVVRDAKIVLDVNKTRQIAQEIVKGMGYLHAKGILHKDLKSKNVFYDNGKVVITDFGLFSISGVLQAGRRENKLRIQNGWLCHLAPEIIRQLSPDTEEDKLPFSKHSDVFALGTIWYELHAREWPFKTQPAEAIIWQVGRGMKPNLSQIGMGKEISDILLFCWAYEQEERPTFTKLMDMLEKLPKRNRRLSHPGHFWKSAE